MIHEWFVNFGALAAALLFGVFFVTRFFLKRKQADSDTKSGRAFGSVFFGIVAAVFLALAFVLVLFGFSGAILGWIGFAILGFAVALGSQATV